MLKQLKGSSDWLKKFWCYGVPIGLALGFLALFWRPDRVAVVLENKSWQNLPPLDSAARAASLKKVSVDFRGRFCAS